MAAQVAQPVKKNVLWPVFGLAAALVVAGVLMNINQSLGISDRTAFFALFLIGMTMCAMGPLGQGAVYGWTNPLHILGYAVGAAALFLGAVVLFRLPVAWIDSERTALLILAGIMLVKMVVARVYRRRA